MRPAPASAQYFGRNKVRYKKLDFQILKTEHFDIYYYPEERQGLEVAARTFLSTRSVFSTDLFVADAATERSCIG